MRRRFSLDIPETLEDACDPARMAVIVYDMQVGVVRQLPDGGAETVERVSGVLTAARAGGYPGVLHPAHVPSGQAHGHGTGAHAFTLTALIT